MQLKPIGLYDPRLEVDSCGIGFVAHLSGRPSHEVVERALEALCCLEHRGAVGGDASSGDGAGVMTQIPQTFFARELHLARRHAHAPLAVGVFFLPQRDAARAACVEVVEQTVRAHGLHHFAWRDVPTNAALLGEKARHTCPVIRHLLLENSLDLDDETFERRLYLIRKRIEATVRQRRVLQPTDTFYVASFSARTVVYKGLMLASQLGQFYPDLQHPDFQSAVAVFHQRYSTNTFPSWTRAQPFRLLCHNGEINTLQGNVNWTRAREGTLDSPVWGDDVEHLLPVIDPTGSDSAMLDNVVELLVRSGRALPAALMMLVPEAWEKQDAMEPQRRAFYAYHAGLSEPWDGPAALTFCDGRLVGTTLDRNGLRPARYVVTDDGWVVSASEDGALAFDETRIVRRGKLGPGQMVVADLHKGTLWEDEQIKSHYAARKPYALWLKRHARRVPQAPIAGAATLPAGELTRWQRVFGYTSEDLSLILRPMASTGHEPVGSMGDDIPPAALSDQPRPLYHFFKQRFAQVTNPAIDSLREERVMSLAVRLGARPSYLQETPEHAHLLELDSPLLHRAQFEALQQAAGEAGFPMETLPITFAVDQGPAGLEPALDALARQAERLVRRGVSLLVLSDRTQDAQHAPMPALLALGAVHHHLIRSGMRPRVSLIVACGDAREVHHVACLIGFGAEAVFPYLALESACGLAQAGKVRAEPAEAVARTVQALEKGLLKTMAKMGISTVAGYHGAQVFETLGLADEVVQRCFTGTSARLGGVGFQAIAQVALTQHQAAYRQEATPLPNLGWYRFKPHGERHAFTPTTVRALHQAVDAGARAFQGVFEREAVDEAVNSEAFQEAYALYRKYAEPLKQRGTAGEAIALRDLLAFHADRDPLPLAEVEPHSAIVKRFSTGAMSHGSLSDEAHRALAVAMNRLGAISNSGEGGEHPARYGTLENSRIKQVASGRFGVTAAYLTSADELQIKIAQGAKPGEGGQLPGHKVSAEIAAIRYTTPGVALISPPPHHDIYSIEDLAQLIYDLKRVNPQAAVSVKLVAETGVGVVAAGVVKGYADVVQISGHAGGTGSSPLNAIKNAGEPWELGLAETQQTLVLNDLRGRVRLRTDGGLQTGRDVLMAVLLGADEVSFGTSALVALGCLMARQCHANTCPVGIATQDIKLRQKFAGKPEALMAYFSFLAQEVREHLAALGYRSWQEVIGRVDLLRPRGGETTAPWDLEKLLVDVDPQHRRARSAQQARNDPPARWTLDYQLVRDTREVFNRRSGLARLRYRIRNTDRSVGAGLAGAIARCHGTDGLPEGSIECRFRGSAGNSFGAFAPPGLKLVLRGVANDYVGKGLCGGQIVLLPDERCRYVRLGRAHEQVILGNTALYGATGGTLFAAGRAGERFAVRNSGAVAVIEGVGAHGCEYMTGGVVVVLGTVGDNFAAGMTGGVAYVLDENETLPQRYNPELVELTRLSADEERERLRSLVLAHVQATHSARAHRLLERWDEVGSLFWRVAPRGTVDQIEAANEGAVLGGVTARA